MDERVRRPVDRLPVGSGAALTHPVMLHDDEIPSLLLTHVGVGDGPHPQGYCSVAFRAIPAEFHATVTAWVERDGLGHRAFHVVHREDAAPFPWSRPSEPFWVIPRARLAPA